MPKVSVWYRITCKWDSFSWNIRKANQLAKKAATRKQDRLTRTCEASTSWHHQTSSRCSKTFSISSWTHICHDNSSRKTSSSTMPKRRWFAILFWRCARCAGPTRRTNPVRLSSSLSPNSRLKTICLRPCRYAWSGTAAIWRRATKSSRQRRTLTWLRSSKCAWKRSRARSS